MMNNDRIDLTGMQIGDWKVIRFAVSGRNSKWLCRCICGREQIVQGNNLRHGRTVCCFKCRGRHMRTLQVGVHLNGWVVIKVDRKRSYPYRIKCNKCKREFWSWHGWIQKNRCKHKDGRK